MGERQACLIFMNLKKSFLLQLVLAGIGVGAASAAEDWTTDFSAARKRAAAEHKKLLLDFTGSDWCAACKQLERDVFPTEDFAAFAKDYILVRVDYPAHKALKEPQKSQNEWLKSEYAIEGFPTVLILDARNRELGRVVGYAPDGPGAYLQSLTAAMKP